MARGIRRAAVLVAHLLFVLTVTATVSAQSTGDHQWRILTSDDGLLSNDIWSVLIVDDTVWLGTDLGISRYDGAWTNYHSAPSAEEGGAYDSGLPSGVVIALAKSLDDGRLWAGTETGSISYWDGDGWNAAGDVAQNLNALAVMDGTLLLGTDRGLFLFDPERNVNDPDEGLGERTVNALFVDGSRLWVGAEDGLWYREADQWTHVDLPESLSTAPVTSLWREASERLWLGTEQGVLWYRPELDRWSTAPIPLYNERNVLMPVQDLTGNDAGAVWAGSIGAGARKILTDRSTVEDVSRVAGGGLTTPLVRDIALDDQGAVWFATPVGLFQFQERAWFNEYLEGEEQDLRMNAVNDLLVDSKGRLWIATAGTGIRRKQPLSIGYSDVIFDSAVGDLPSDGVNALEEDVHGAVWAGTFGGVARYQDRHWSTPILSSSLPSMVVTDFLADDDGLWIGTEAGLAYYDLAADELTTETELAGQVIEVLATDGDGRLWVGTFDDGIWIQTGEDWQRMDVDPDTSGKLPGERIVTGGLAQVPGTEQEMWANVHDVGLVHWDGNQWQTAPNELPSKVLYRLFTDPRGNLWVGSEGGVSRFDGVTWETFSVIDGLQSTAIYAIVYDPQGAYWFGGPEGLTRYEPDDSPPWVNIQSVEGGESVDGEYQVNADESLLLSIAAGDLQTLPEKLKIFFRMNGADEWRELEEQPLMLSFDEAQAAIVEFMARDQAFNYSNVLDYEFAVVPPPALLTLPVLGEVERNVVGLLALLGSMALIGFGYASYELFRDRVRSYAAMDRGFNPYVSGEPIRTEDMFFGRQDLLVRIVNTLHNNSIMIHGERRIGKTTLLYQLANTLRQIDDPDYWFVTVYVDLEGTTQKEFFHFLIEEIATTVKELPDTDESLLAVVDSLGFYQCDSQDYDDRNFNNDLRRIVSGLQNHAQAHHQGRNVRLILLLDEMDVISSYDRLIQQQLRRIFMRDFAATLGAVVAGIQISKDWDRVESPWFNLFNEIALEPFTREQALELLIKPVHNIYRYDPSALEYIMEQSDGRPFRIQQYALESVNHMLSARRRKITLEDTEVAHAHIQVNYGDITSPSETGLLAAVGSES